VLTTGLNPILSNNNFTFGSSSTCPQLDTSSSPATLAPGVSCTDLISFSPMAIGSIAGTLAITDNNLNASPSATQTINLSGSATVGTQTITFPQPPTPVTYGAARVTLAATASSGLAVSYAVTSGPAMISGSTLTFTGAGTVTVTASQAGDTNNSAATPVSDTIVVNPAALTVTAANATRVFGAANPAFTGTYAGAVNGDTFTVSGTTTATTASAVGTYPITPTASGTDLADYAVTYVNGTLTVTGASTTTALTSSASAITAGQSVTFTATVKAGTTPATIGTVTFLNGTTSIGTGVLNAGGVATFTTSTLPVGANPSFTASYGATTDYAASVSAPVTVTVAAPGVAGTTTTVTANPVSIIAGGSVTLAATVASSSGTATGMVTFTNGSASLGTANLSAGVATLTIATLPVGTDIITASYGGAATFAASSGSASVTVNPATPPSYTIVPASTTLSTTQGQNASTTLTLTPVGGYSGTVVFSCQNLPANAKCAFAQNPVTLTGNNQPVNVGITIATDVQQAKLAAPPTSTPLNPLLPALAFWWPGCLAGLGAIGPKRKLSKTQQRWLQLCLLLVATGALAAGLSGCGGVSSVTPTSATTVTVTATATSGTNVTTQTVALTLTITQ
jgi:MBG domain (YGX type)/Bacterial Ig-like domain (group 3)